MLHYFGHTNDKMINPLCLHVLTPTARAVFLRVFIHMLIYRGLAENVFHGLKECSKRVKLRNAFKEHPLCVSGSVHFVFRSSVSLPYDL